MKLLQNPDLVLRAGGLIIGVLALMVIGIVFAVAPIQAGPEAQPTLLNNQYPGGSAPYVINGITGASVVGNAAFPTRVLTADLTGTCFKAPEARALVVHLTLDQGTVNTTTVRLRHTNTLPNTAVNGAAIVSAGTADSNTLNEYPNSGQFTCLQFDVTNTNPLTVNNASILVLR